MPSKWLHIADRWDDDDPAIQRMRDALALQAAPRTAQNAPQRPPTVEVASVSRHEAIGQLVRRIRSGDLSAVELLRRLIDGG